ncbi:MAG: hypothetical protein AAF907_03950 [Planctomycetota bacterium]
MRTIEPDSERFDLPEPPDEELRPDVGAAVEHLRETLTDEMALRGFKSAHQREPTPDELEAFREELVADAYNFGLTDWYDKAADEFLDWD